MLCLFYCYKFLKKRPSTLLRFLECLVNKTKPATQSPLFEYLLGEVVTRAGEGPAVGGQAGGVGTGHSTPTWPVQIKLRAPQLLSFLQFNNKVQPRLRLKIVFLSRHVIFPELAGPCSPPWKNAPATEPWKLHDFLH